MKFLGLKVVDMCKYLMFNTIHLHIYKSVVFSTFDKKNSTVTNAKIPSKCTIGFKLGIHFSSHVTDFSICGKICLNTTIKRRVLCGKMLGIK